MIPIVDLAGQTASRPFGQDLSRSTVTEDSFQSRWVRPPAKPERVENQLEVVEPEGGPTAEELGVVPFFDLRRPLREGIQIGPVDIGLGLGLGWEYSDQTDTGQETNPEDNDSPFVAPSIDLLYKRAIGPWSVAASYDAGLRYYTNPDYDAAGSGNQRNPFSQTVAISVGHLGARHEANVSFNGSYGTGFDVAADEVLTQARLGFVADYLYALTQYVEVGADAAYSTRISSNNGDGGSGNGDTSSFGGNLNVDYLWTGKTTLTYSLGAGGDTQALEGSEPVARTYVQTLVGIVYRPKGKIEANLGVGVGYVDDPGISRGQFTGVRGLYRGGFTYHLTDKTSAFAEIGFLGADIRPEGRLGVVWNFRDTTQFSFSAYQEQGFSLTTADQFQITRGVIGSISQRLFSRLDLTVSAGWQQIEDVDLETGEFSSNDGNRAYAFCSGGVTWAIRDWLAFVANVRINSGSGSSSRSDEPETRASVSFNFSL